MASLVLHTAPTVDRLSTAWSNIHSHRANQVHTANRVHMANQVHTANRVHMVNRVHTANRANQVLACNLVIR